MLTDYFCYLFADNGLFLQAEVQNKPELPWAPKSPTFHIGAPKKSKSGNQKPNQPVPNLLPISPIGVPSTSRGVTDASEEAEKDELMYAQININSKIMAEIEELREDRKQHLKQIEQYAKEKEVLKVKLLQMNAQLQNFKRKADNKNGKDENDDPNKGQPIEEANVGQKKGQPNEANNAEPAQGKANAEANAEPK